jgi:hypothetical protein
VRILLEQETTVMTTMMMVVEAVALAAGLAAVAVL